MAIKTTFEYLHDEFEKEWKKLKYSERNVAKAGEISRNIDKNRSNIIKKLTFEAPQNLQL